MTHIASRAFAFDLLVAAAVEGRRCPMNGQIADSLAIHGLPVGGNIVTELCEHGHIRSYVYALNYGVVEIRTGAHAGKTTAPAARGLEPYKVVDNGGAPAAQPLPRFEDCERPQSVRKLGPKAISKPRLGTGRQPAHCAVVLPVAQSDGFIKPPSREQLMGKR